jgi:TPR repeat protein
LGYLYQFGKGVKKNHQLAQSYYQEALNKGYLLAKGNLEIMEKNETSTGSLTVSTDDANHYDEYFNFGDACLGGINRVQDIGSAYSYYDSEMKHSHGKGSIERGLAMYYQYCRPGSDEFTCAFNLYLISIECGHIASNYFLGMLLLQNRFFKAARMIFEKLLDQKPQNVSYLFVENENEFMNQKYSVPRFTTITEQMLFSKASLRHQYSLAFERIEEQWYKEWSPMFMDII